VKAREKGKGGRMTVRWTNRKRKERTRGGNMNEDKGTDRRKGYGMRVQKICRK
jgi:hypothetical protein